MKKIAVFWLLALPLVAQQTSPFKKNIYQDIYQDENEDNLIFGNSQVRLEFNRKSGAWVGFYQSVTTGNLIKASRLADTFDFWIDGREVLANGLPSLRDAFTRTNEGDESVTFAQTFRIKNSTHQFIEFQIYYKIFAKDAYIERSANVRRVAMNNTMATEVGLQRPHFERITFKMPAFQLGSSKDCFFDVAGAFSKHNFIAPSTPFDSLRNRKIELQQAPDAGFGLVSMSNPSLKTTFATWMNTRGEAAYQPFLDANYQGVTLGQHDLRSVYFDENSVIQSDIQHLFFKKSPKEVFESYQIQNAEMFPIAPTPTWANEMVLLELNPSYFRDGFREIAEKLPEYKQVGFNTIHLMPHWAGGYLPVDFYTINPDYGTENDLKNLVRVAHNLGMKVLFDMVIHGVSDASDLIRKQPQMFVQNEDTKFGRHPVWKSISSNWVNPVYQQYMADLAMKHVLDYDIDGYYIDAPIFKGAGWDISSPNPAYVSGSASQVLMQKMLRAMQVAKTDVLFLSNAFGPIFYTVSNAVYDNETEAIQKLSELVQVGKFTASDYKKQLAMTYACLPEGVNRIFFSRNHNTAKNYRFNKYNEYIKAFDAVHTFFGIPEFFAGEPDHEPNPDPETWAYYKKLYDFRKSHEEFAGGKILLNEVRSENPRVFAGMRQKNKNSLVLISMSDKIESVSVEIPDGFPNQVLLSDVLSEEKSKVLTEGKILRLSLKPFQIFVARW